MRSIALVCDMNTLNSESCLKCFGVTEFSGFQFQSASWISAEIESHRLRLELRRSTIVDAGLGVFALTRFITGPSGQFLCNYAGEPVQEWIYDAIEDDDRQNYAGVRFQIKNLQPGIWRGIANTLGPSFNAAKHSRQAQLELRIDPSKVDHQQHIFKAEGFVQVWIKGNTIVEIGDELLLFYSKLFWRELETRSLETREPYCVLCLLFHSTRIDPMFLCDQCNHGFHLHCLKRWNESNIPNDTNSEKKWYCINCQVL